METVLAIKDLYCIFGLWVLSTINKRLIYFYPSNSFVFLLYLLTMPKFTKYCIWPEIFNPVYLARHWLVFSPKQCENIVKILYLSLYPGHWAVAVIYITLSLLYLDSGRQTSAPHFLKALINICWKSYTNLRIYCIYISKTTGIINILLHQIKVGRGIKYPLGNLPSLLHGPSPKFAMGPSYSCINYRLGRAEFSVRSWTVRSGQLRGEDIRLLFEWRTYLLHVRVKCWKGKCVISLWLVWQSGLQL